MDGRKIQRARQEAWKQVRQEYKDDSECCFAFGFEAGYRFAVAPRVEPPVTESGEGFESLPAEPKTQPQALRLADILAEQGFAERTGNNYGKEAAAELRRLHAEVECEERRFNELWDSYDKLAKVNAQLLEALEK